MWGGVVDAPKDEDEAFCKDSLSIDQKIAWMVLAGFVECLLRHNIELLHNSGTSDCFQISLIIQKTNIYKTASMKSH